MRKILLVLTFIFTIFFIWGTNTAKAEYPRYLNGNHNYECVYGKRGDFYYIERDSIQPILYNPPYYQIQGRIVVVKDAHKGGTDIIRQFYCRIMFDMYKNRMVLINPETRAPVLSVTPRSADSWAGFIPYAGNYMFNVCYGRKFW